MRSFTCLLTMSTTKNARHCLYSRNETILRVGEKVTDYRPWDPRSDLVTDPLRLLFPYISITSLEVKSQQCKNLGSIKNTVSQGYVLQPDILGRSR